LTTSVQASDADGDQTSDSWDLTVIGH